MVRSKTKEVMQYLKTFHRIFSTRTDCEKQDLKTAGILIEETVIGDEILKGEVVDTNSSHVTRRLHKLGIHVRKISIIGDSVPDIAEEVKVYSRKYDYVVTTGGIGPTHDDVTFEGVAKAFNEPVHAHPELVQICTRFYNTDNLKSPGMKLAYVPVSSVLVYSVDKAGVKSRYPIVTVKNVHLFPGVPQLFETSFDNVCEILFKSRSKFYTKFVYVNVAEYKIVEALDALVKQCPKVCIGSYPSFSNGKYTVKISIESTEEQKTMEAFDKLLKMIPVEAIVTQLEEK